MGTPQFGERIRQARLARHLTLHDVSRMSDVDVATLSRLENDKRVPRVERLYAVTKAVGLDGIDDFFDSEDEQ